MSPLNFFMYISVVLAAVLMVWKSPRAYSGNYGTRRDKVNGIKRLGRKFQRIKNRNTDDVQFISFLRRFSSLLLSGYAVPAVWRYLYKNSHRFPEFRELADRGYAAASAGLSVSRAVLDYAQALSKQQRKRILLIELGSILVIAERSGAPLAELLSRLAEHREREIEAEALRQNALAGPKATAALLNYLPVAGLLIAMLGGIDIFTVLFSTPMGVLAAVAGLVLMLLARLWTVRLLADAARP